VAIVLRGRGAEVRIATSVEQAVALFEDRPPMVLVSDIGMPVLDGYGLLQRLRSLGPAAAQVPAIALTAYARQEDRRRALEAGFQGYLSKPVEPDALVRVVSRLGHGPSVMGHSARAS
jgi:CheY-like chemotaxis protein